MKDTASLPCALWHRLRHWLLFARIAAHVALRYAGTLPVQEYTCFLRRAAQLVWVFRHNRIVRIAEGYKLQLYLPAYPSPAFFRALENKLLRTPPASTSVVFSMTRACANACPHCYQKTERGADLNPAQLVRTFKDMLASGVTFFNIEGGEPFLRQDRLLALLDERTDTAEVWVNTSGTGVSRESLAMLKHKGMTGIMVSLHASDAAGHDAFTGVPGSFFLACRALEWARDLGLGTAVNSVLSELALRGNGLASLMNLAKTLRTEYVQLIHPKPCGGWMEQTEGMQTDHALLRSIEESHIRYNSPAMAGYPSLAAQVFEEREHGMGCTAGGVERFYVTATGEVQPCEFVQLSFGNVTNEDFAVIFTRMREAYPEPATGWLCTAQGQAIGAFIRKHGLASTPIPWPLTQVFLAERDGRDAGKLTPLYVNMGIYTP